MGEEDERQRERRRRHVGEELDFCRAQIQRYQERSQHYEERARLYEERARASEERAKGYEERIAALDEEWRALSADQPPTRAPEIDGSQGDTPPRPEAPPAVPEGPRFTRTTAPRPVLLPVSSYSGSPLARMLAEGASRESPGGTEAP